MRSAALLVVVAACWTGAPPASSPSSPAPEAPAALPFPRHSVWVGTYRCLQGVSAVRLTVDARADGRAIARYEFGPTETNPDVPDGEYELAGTIRATGPGAFALELEAVRWIHQPDGYFMVGVSLETAGDPRTLRGTIHHATCGDFRARRVG